MVVRSQLEDHNSDYRTTEMHSKGVDGGQDIWSGDDHGELSDIKLLFNADVVWTNADMCTNSKGHIVYISVANTEIPMVLDSGSEITVLRKDILPKDFVTTCEEVNHTQLIGAFGGPVNADLTTVDAALLGDSRDYAPVSLKVALCPELNGETGLLSLADYQTLQNGAVFLTRVGMEDKSGRLDSCQDDTLNFSKRLIFNKLNLFPIDLSSESYEKFKDDQLSDSTLISCWLKATSGSTEFVINSENGLLFHKHTSGKTEVFQLVIPENRRQTVVASSYDLYASHHLS